MAQPVIEQTADSLAQPEVDDRTSTHSNEQVQQYLVKFEEKI